MLPNVHIESYASLIGLDSKGTKQDAPEEGKTGPEETVQETARNERNAIECLCSILHYLGPNSAEKDKSLSWKADVEFMSQCRQLACFHSELLAPLLPAILRKICDLCKSLRSIVARSAIKAAEDILKFSPSFPEEAKELVGVVAQRTGSEKQFVRDESVQCLEAVPLQAILHV